MNAAPFPHRMVTPGRHIRHDPLLGHAFVPSVHRRVPHEHGAYFAVTNAQGFREDHDLAAAPDRFCVMCYGDSYTAGDGVDNDERFSARLAARLCVTVTNVAVPGHGPDQNLLQLERVPLPRTDLILWCIAVPTIERIQSPQRITMDREGRLWRVGRPHFVLAGDGSLELRGVPVAEQGEELFEPPLRQVRSPVAAICAHAAAKVRTRLVAALGTWLKPAPDPEYADRQSPGFRLMAALVRRFHAAAGGVPVAIVPLPTARYVAEDNEPYFQRRFAELARPAEGLHVLDVHTALRRASRTERSGFHYRFDGHFTAAGHTALAAALAEQLQGSGLVAAGPSPRGVASARVGGGQPTLEVGWQPDDGYARLRAGAGGRLVAEHRERQITGRACRPGVLPLSSVHACLDEGRVAGPELGAVALRSPCTAKDLARLDRRDARWFSLASGWVRWHGAAEADLRSFLCYRGPLRHEADAAPAPDTALRESPPPPITPDDDELRWLRQRLARLPAGADDATLRRRLLRLCRRWELVTRTAREAALPTSAPLRRGRMARRLAAAGRAGHSVTGSAPPRGRPGPGPPR